MKIYTKTGDSGTTGLADGRRVSKSSLRIEAYGSLDTLNSNLGYAKMLVKYPRTPQILETVQNDIFVLGADLATPYDIRLEKVLRLKKDRIGFLEDTTDEIQSKLRPLKKFVLPGGTAGAAYLHVCRTACREAERKVVRLSGKEKINLTNVPYLNRLSSLLFVLARVENQNAGVEEQTWGRERLGV